MKKHWFIIIFITIAIILPLIWLKGDFIYVGEESVFTNSQSLLDKNLYSWSTGINYGEPAAHWNHSLIMPNGIFYYLLSSLGFSNPLIQKVFLSMIILVLLLSISYFIRLFTNNKLLVAAGSLFYLLNFYTANSLFYSAKMYQLILLPLFFVFLYKYLKENKNIYIFYNFLALFFLQAIFTNLPQLITTLLVYILTLIYFCLEERVGLRAFLHRYLLKIIHFLLPLIPICLYHLLVIYFSVMQNTQELKSQTLSFISLKSSIWQILQLRGSWWSSKDYEGIAYNLWHSFYNNPAIVVISFLIISPVVLAIRKIRDGLSYRFWLIISLLFLFLSSGFSFYPQIYSWMFEHIPYFYVFREPWAKFIPLFLFSSTALLIISLNHLRKNYLIWIILLLIIIRGFPFFSTNFFDRSNFGWKKLFVKIPEYWQQYNGWTKENRNSYILPLPFFTNSNDFMIYKWYKRNLGNFALPAYSLFASNNSIFASSHFASLSNYTNVADAFWKNGSLDFVTLGPIDYLLEQKDLDLNYKRTKEFYDKQNEVKKYFDGSPTAVFGDKLFLYKIKKEFYTPKFYTAQYIISTNKVTDSLPALSASGNLKKYTAVYESSDIEKITNFSNLSMNKILVAFSEDKNRIIGELEKILNETYSEITKWSNLKEINNGLNAAGQNILDEKINYKNEIEKKLQEAINEHYVYWVENKLGTEKKINLEFIINKDNKPNTSVPQVSINEKLYKLNEKSTPDGVFALKDISLHPGSLSFKSEDLILKSVILKQNNNPQNATEAPSAVEYKKINPTKYKLMARGASGVFPLIFNEDYHNGWKLYLSNDNFYDTWFKKSVAEDSHLITNGYANSWLIDPQDLCNQVKSNKCIKNQDGTYDLTFMVVYWPQRMFVLAATIMILTLLAILILVLFRKRRIKHPHQSWT